MNQSLIEVEGTLLADGTLELDKKLNFPPGRVSVTVRPVFQPPADDPFWQRMQAIWDSLKAAGHRPRTREEIDADLRAMDEEAESEMQETERLQVESRRTREGHAWP